MERHVVERHAFARVGLLGNPSDGYFGRTLSVTLRNFSATVTLEESDDIHLEPDPSRANVFRNVGELVGSAMRETDDGGVMLLKATVKTLADHCARHELTLPPRNFTARYHSSIPRQVGLGGSSAIVTAALRALLEFFELEIPRERQANLVLAAEVEELGITAGLQDRVVQVYEGLVYMDFARELMEWRGYGAYELLDLSLLPPMFVAYQTQSTKVSGRILTDLRARWERGDEEVHETLDRIAALASEGKDALLDGQHAHFASLMNENFDLRRRIMHIDERDIAMVEATRSLGASAKLTGSGGAIVGAFDGDEMRACLTERLHVLGAQVVVAETMATAPSR